MKVTVASFIKSLQELELLQLHQLDEIRKIQPTVSDAKHLAKLLMQRDLITPHQANLILQGREKELVIGPYRVLCKLGEGGMGAVYKACHVRMQRIVALKVIPKNRMSASGAQRFFREARAAAQLQHPNIVMAFDADQVGNIHFIAMEYAEGVDLEKFVMEKGVLPVSQACNYACQVAKGLQHAHERKIVHRDIKPSNLLLTRSAPDAPLQVKILDFGLAFVEDDPNPKTRLTMLNSLLGTIDYISPEQAENARNADIRSDIYSLGCTLFFLLSGRVPFDGSDPMGRMMARLIENPPTLSSTKTNVPQALEKAIEKMLARNPTDRYQTPNDVVQALAPFVRSKVTRGANIERTNAVSKPRQPAETMIISQRKKPNITNGRKKGSPASLLTYGIIAAVTSFAFVGLGVGAFVVFGSLSNPEKSKIARQDSTPLSPEPPGNSRPNQPDESKPNQTDKTQPIKSVDPKDNSATKTKQPVNSENLPPFTDNPKPNKESDPKPNPKTEPQKSEPKGQNEPPKSKLLPDEIVVLKGHSTAVTQIGISPDSKKLVSGDDESNLYVWDLQTATKNSDLAVPGAITQIKFSSDRNQFTVLSTEKNEWHGSVFETQSQQLRRRINKRDTSPPAFARKMVLSPDGKRIFTFTLNSVGDRRLLGIIQTTDLSALQGRSSPQIFRSEVSIKHLAISPDNLSAVSAMGTNPDALVLWNLKTGTRSFFQPQTFAINCLAYSPKGRFLLSGSMKGIVSLWDTKSGRKVKDLIGDKGPVHSISFSPDGLHTVSGGADGIVRVWNLSSGKEMKRYSGHSGGVNCTGYTPDGTKIISAGADKLIRIWRVPR